MRSDGDGDGRWRSGNAADNAANCDGDGRWSRV